MKKLGVLCFFLCVLTCPSLHAQEIVWREHMETGIAALNQSEYDTAVVEFSIALEIAEKYYQDSTWLGDTYAHLAGAYKSKSNYVEAEKYFLAAIESTEKVLGQGDVYTAQYLNHLGNTYLDMGNLQEGLELNERALDILASNSVNGATLAKIQASVGYGYYKNGQYSEAIVIYQEALQVLEAELGRIHPDVSKVYHSIGQTQIELHNYQEAEIAHKECLSRRIEYFGPRHENVGWTYNNLAWVYILAGRYSEAEHNLELALLTWRKIPDSNPKNIGTVLSNYCVLRDYQDLYEEAVSFCEESLSILIAGYGEDHEFVSNTQTNLNIAVDHMKYR
jgi:tetratricopeptide (TPR) repeat protein